MNEQNKTYNAKDFANYHAGKMPEQEMYALERAALEDDFLADALEGYANTNNAENEIAEIKERLVSKKDTAKVIPIGSSIKKNWMRIAAAVIIFMGLGYLFLNVNKKSAESSLAKKEVKTNTSAPNKESNSLEKVRSEIKDSINILELQLTKNKADANTTEPSKWPDAIDSTPLPTTSSTNSPIAIYDNKPEIIAPSEKAFLNNNQQNQSLNNNSQELTLNKSGGPKQRSQNRLNNISNNNGILNNNKTFDDALKIKKFKSISDSVAINDIAKNDTRVITEQADNAQTASLAKENKEAKLEEVVVTGYGNKAKKDVSQNANVTNALEGRVAGVNVTKAKASKIMADINDRKKLQTEESLRQFNNYVSKNTNPIFDNDGNEIKGKVILSFKTNKKGQAIKIKVVQSLSDACDKQAIQLLKNSMTTWAVNKSDRQVVEIVY